MTEHRPSEVIYQVYPSSFADSDGDGLGDLKGILDRLDYIGELGVDAVWISPVFLTPKGPDGDGGYAITDYREIDPKYGTIDDFKAVLDKAHELGLRVYTDFVLAHTANDHEWFEKSRSRKEPYTDYYVWHDGHKDEHGNRQPPNNWKSVFGGPAWNWDDKREQWYLHHFLKSQPALNNNIEKVQDAVLDEMRFWLDMGVDGFRLDAMPFANHDPDLRNNPWRDGQWPRDSEHWEEQYFAHSICQDSTIDFIARIREMMDSYTDKKTTLGEAISGPDGGGDSVPVAASYVDAEKGLDMCYTNALMSIWEYPDAARITGMVKHLEHHFPEGGNCNSASNHDIPRSASRMTKNVADEHKDKAVRQLMDMFISLPGSFCMYQGEELGLPAARIPEDIPLDKLQDPVAFTKGLGDSRDGARTPFPWDSGKRNLGFSESDTPYLPAPKSHKNLAVDLQEKDPESMLNFTRDRLKWRKAQPALQKGKTTVIGNIPAPLVGFMRESKEQSILCLFNMSSAPQSIKLSDYFNEMQCKSLNIKQDETVTLDAYGSRFYGDKPVTVSIGAKTGAKKKTPKTGT